MGKLHLACNLIENFRQENQYEGSNHSGIDGSPFLSLASAQSSPPEVRCLSVCLFVCTRLSWQDEYEKQHNKKERQQRSGRLHHTREDLSGKKKNAKQRSSGENTWRGANTRP
ncbi:hypothetical protein E2C01_071368 [Portunus trituberculatus]|uniref:Uncharacterized protein n=1 Tax=Portunus trituberculatus TaxID=210409 RepID=A0A5B7HWT7_PORTR|nr:hypothetical protein [Portunus trituberculatus]